jgi:CxxC-x17-CxxC domain-containing protein
MSDIALFAETTYRNQYRRFGIKTDDRRRHMYLIGKTGMGKSTILENMIIDDIRAGRGVAVVDPHGDLAEKIIQFIPKNRINDVIYFNPADVDFPIAFNVVEQVEPHLRHLVASGLIGVFEKLWADSWGPRLEYILRNSILAILDYPNSTLLGVTRMLSDKSFRKKVVEQIQDPVVKAFWTKEFAGYADKFASEAVSPIQNKVGQFLSSSLIRNIVGQVHSSIDLREVMDNGKILIMNLSKGRIGEDNSELLGSMVITKIQLAAMSRVNVSEIERRDFYLYVDEFQNFATDSFANILSEARKYRLNLIMGHQYIEQLSDKVKAAVFGNVGTLVVFRVGATDAEELVKEFTPVFTEEDLVNLPKYNTCLKLMIDGVASDPFSARGLPPLTESERTHNEEKIIQATRMNYSGERQEVEDKIMRWHAESEETVRITGPSAQSNAKSNSKSNIAYQPPVPQSASYRSTPQSIFPVSPESKSNISLPQTSILPSQSPISAQEHPHPQAYSAQAVENSKPILDPSIYKYEAICSRCQKTTRLPFKPDGIRPVFCKDCLMILRKENEQSTLERKVLKHREVEQHIHRPNYTASFANSINSESLPKVLPPEATIEPIEVIKPLSLRDLPQEAPRDFKGRPLKPETRGHLEPGQPIHFN